MIVKRKEGYAGDTAESGGAVSNEGRSGQKIKSSGIL